METVTLDDSLKKYFCGKEQRIWAVTEREHWGHESVGFFLHLYADKNDH